MGAGPGAQPHSSVLELLVLTPLQPWGRRAAIATATSTGSAAGSHGPEAL